jgi:hypothetical protein
MCPKGTNSYEGQNQFLTPKGQMSIWRLKKMSGHAIVNAIFT